ncbi:hypothetical protein ACFQZS_00480 [Mucilaginibacter calamicampi]|uniref:Outer membrane protein beta-barrel domain-containing protein n=1 Tax=Mucilaginibacter calamicampi TaxID=1302352 RepID=A0ABW2YVL6_9SPHI
MSQRFFKAPVATLLICFLCLTAKAQLGYEYAQYDIGFGAAASRVIGSDAEVVTFAPTGYVNFAYNLTPYINYVVEVQGGILKGGSYTSRSKRYFENQYTAAMFRAQIQAGEFIKYSDSRIMNGLKNFYFSTGIGFVVNKLDIDPNLRIPDDLGYYTPGRNHSNQVLIPARIGYEFKIFNKYNQPSVKIDLGYQFNYVLGDDLDGFETGNSQNDVYDQVSIGVKFGIGGITSYRKAIKY